MTSNRRQWIQQTTLATLGLGVSLRSMGNEEGISRYFGSEKGLINLGSNENPYGLSPIAKQAINGLMGETNRYPFNIASLQSFRKTLAAHYGFTADNMIITPGSGDGLNLLARHFNKGNIVTANPTFGILPGTAKKIGTQVIEVPLTYDKVHDLDAMMKAITPDTSLVYICNPANPTATILKPEALKNFCIEASKKAVVLIDEAYIDFLDAPDNVSMTSLIDQHPNILVIRTFSKIYAMAGLRVGYILGHPSLIKQIEPNYFQSSQLAVSVLSQAAAMASLKDGTHANNSKQKNAAARKFTYEELTKMNLRCIPSYTNFLFFQLNNYKGDFAQDMLAKKIILRSSDYTDGKWARVSVGTIDEMRDFIDKMKKQFS